MCYKRVPSKLGTQRTVIPPMTAHDNLHAGELDPEDCSVAAADPFDDEGGVPASLFVCKGILFVVPASLPAMKVSVLSFEKV